MSGKKSHQNGFEIIYQLCYRINSINCIISTDEDGEEKGGFSAMLNLVKPRIFRPLSEGRMLKTKFDDIFAATR